MKVNQLNEGEGIDEEGTDHPEILSEAQAEAN